MRKIALFLFIVLTGGALYSGTPMFDSKTNNIYLCDSLKISYTTSSTTSSYSSYSYSGYSYSYQCYRSGYWFWSRTSCGASYSSYSYSSSSYSTSTTVTQHVEDNNSGAEDGFVVLGSSSNFPYGYICDRDVYTATWKSVHALCSGYQMQYRRTDRTVDAPAEGDAYCWKWNCKPGYAMIAGGECVSQSECTERGLNWKGTSCEGFQFCSGWGQYNQSSHSPIAKGSCYEYRCQAEYAGFRSTTDHSCIATNVRYTRGGYYANKEMNDDGVARQCNNNQYNDKVNNRWVCRNMVIAPKQKFNDCWGCKTKDSMIACLNSSAVPDNCKVNTGNGL